MTPTQTWCSEPTRLGFKAWGLLATLFLSACNTTTDTAPFANISSQPTEQAQMVQDREAILAMAGNYRVTFDFQETVAFQEGYKLKERYKTGGYEVVTVIENEPTFISLQHILVVGNGDDMPFMPVKHWRQDWQYEPNHILSYVGANVWENEAVTPEARTGAWSQTVYQVDDAPRYAAVARWQHKNGESSWTSPPSKRPLPRRDATKRDDYHVIIARNRHALTPDGWVHEQDNAKVILSADKPQTLVHEIGINSYQRNDSFSTETATNYWAKTASFWSEIRDVWTAIISNHKQLGLTVLGEPSELYMQILGLASDVEDGTLTAQAAAKEAKKIIHDYVTLSPQSVQARLNSQKG